MLINKSFRFVAFAVIGAATFAGGARRLAAQSQDAHLGVAVKATTLGVALEAAVPVGERVNVRGGFNFFSLSHDFDNDGITLASKLKLRSLNAYLDWFPFGGGFHLTPGLMVYNGNEVDADATVPGGKKFSLGDDDLFSDPNAPVTGTAKISFAKVAPLFLLGWGNGVPRGNRHWSIPFEIGVAVSRAPTGTLALTGNGCASASPRVNCRSIASDPQLKQDLQDQVDKLNHDLKPLKALPIVSLGFAYRF